MRLAAIAGLLACIPASVLAARECTAQEALDPGRFDPSWKGIVFGSTRAEVEDFLKRRIRARFEPKIQDTMDVRERDALTREMKRLLAGVGKDYVDFDESGDAWDVSAVKGEFRKGFGEQMLDVRDGKDHTYLFFTKGVFYKLVRTMADPGGQELLKKLVGLYGEPVRRDEDAGEMRAWWEAGLLSLQLRRNKGLLNCVCLRWALRTADEAVRKAWSKTDTRRDDIDPLVREAQEPPGTRRKVDPVDEILGGSPAD